MDHNEKKIEFYGGTAGIWIPVIVMLIGMIVNTVLAGGLATLPMVTFLATQRHRPSGFVCGETHQSRLCERISR